MPDPVLNTLGGAAQPALGALLLKILIYVVGPVTAAMVVMFMAQPKTAREWFSAVISTVMCSMGLGSYIINNFLAIDPTGSILAGMQAGSLYFLCGLPGWFFVRALFFTFERHQQTDILEILDKIRSKK